MGQRAGERPYGEVVASMCVSIVGGAGPERVNPSFRVTRDEARVALRRMRASPAPLERPLVVLGGINEVGYGPWLTRREIDPVVRGKVTTIVYPLADRFTYCRKKVIEGVDRAFGSTRDDETVEVDVIGQSMGGVIAMFSAMRDDSFGKRLRIRRLFTLASPLNGARLANALSWVSPLPLHHDLRTESVNKLKLHDSIDYDVVSYTRLNDGIVGARYAYLPTAPGVWWVDHPPFDLPHTGCFADVRVLADIARRLRGESPLTASEPAPLPEEERR
jgi:hypothetical protein